VTIVVEAAISGEGAGRAHPAAAAAATKTVVHNARVTRQILPPVGPEGAGNPKIYIGRWRDADFGRISFAVC
jgi:hypothetical protein